MKVARVCLNSWIESLLHTCNVRFTLGCGQKRYFATAFAHNNKVLAVVMLSFKTRGHLPEALLQDFAVKIIMLCRKVSIPVHFVCRLFWRFTLRKLDCRVQWQAHSRSIHCTFAERPTWEGVAWKKAKLKPCRTLHEPWRIETNWEPKKKASKVEVKNKPRECLEPVEGFLLKKCELESQKAKTFNKNIIEI